MCDGVQGDLLRSGIIRWAWRGGVTWTVRRGRRASRCTCCTCQGGRCRKGVEGEGRGLSGLHQHQLMMMRRPYLGRRKGMSKRRCSATPTLHPGPVCGGTSHLSGHTSKVNRAAIPPVRRGRPDSSCEKGAGERGEMCCTPMQAMGQGGAFGRAAW